MIKNKANTNMMIFNRDESKLLNSDLKNSLRIHPFTHLPKTLLNVCPTACLKDRKTCKTQSGFKALTGLWELPKCKMRKLCLESKFFREF